MHTTVSINPNDITPDNVQRLLVNTNTDILMATDLLYLYGERFDRSSNHPLYRRCLRALNALAARGFLERYYIPQANVTIFHRPFRLPYV